MDGSILNAGYSKKNKAAVLSVHLPCLKFFRNVPCLMKQDVWAACFDLLLHTCDQNRKCRAGGASILSCVAIVGSTS